MSDEDLKKLPDVEALMEKLPAEDWPPQPTEEFLAAADEITKRVAESPEAFSPALPDVPVDVSAALDKLDEEQLTDDEARELAGELASKVKVDAQVSPLTPEQEADQELSLQVYECPQGHKQHGPMELVATSKHTGEVIAKSGPTCCACQVLDLGRRYPTFPVTESATRAERRKLAAVKRKRRRRAN